MPRDRIKQRPTMKPEMNMGEMMAAPVRKVAKAALGFAVEQVNRGVRASKRQALQSTIDRLKGKKSR